MKGKVYHFLNRSSIGGVFIAALILISVLCFTLETEFKNSVALRQLNLGIAFIFLLEYIGRIWTADLDQPQKRKPALAYVFSFHGIIDLLAFLPALLLPMANGSVILRILRVLRLAQIMKFKSLSRAIKSVSAALQHSKTELMVSFAVSLAMIFIGAVLMYFVEGKAQPEAFGSIPRSLWWSMATLTTVGYGDVYPLTGLGRILASFMAIVGVAAVAMPAGILAAAFTRPKSKEDDR